ncbi:MAG: hypothetical protein LPK26_20890 [Bacillaceae bacterium]|nr:hypothetical protein [Bacillaceae bacterium]
MEQPLKLIDGIIQPKAHFTGLKESKIITGFGWRLTILVFASGILNATYSYMGLGTEELMSQMDQVSASKLEWAKVVMGLGTFLGGLIYPIFLILFFSLLFLIFFKELNFRSLLYLQLYIVPIFLFEKLFNLPYYLLLGIDRTLSPHSLGPIFQQFLSYDFFIYFISSFTFFNLWAIFIQSMSLHILSSQGLKRTLIIVVASHLFLSLLTALTATLINQVHIIL